MKRNFSMQKVAFLFVCFLFFVLIENGSIKSFNLKKVFSIKNLGFPIEKLAFSAIIQVFRSENLDSRIILHLDCHRRHG